MMSYETILFSVDAGIARLTLNHPDKLNSFNSVMHAEVWQALERLPAAGARVLVRAAVSAPDRIWAIGPLHRAAFWGVDP